MKNKNVVFTTLSLISQLGISMITPVILCAGIGYFLEKKYDIRLTIPLIILGILAGGRNIYVLIKHVADKMTAKEDEEE